MLRSRCWLSCWRGVAAGGTDPLSWLGLLLSSWMPVKFNPGFTKWEMRANYAGHELSTTLAASAGTYYKQISIWSYLNSEPLQKSKQRWPSEKPFCWLTTVMMDRPAYIVSVNKFPKKPNQVFSCWQLWLFVPTMPPGQAHEALKLEASECGGP